MSWLLPGRTGSSGGRLGGGGGGAVHMVGAVNLARARSLFVVASVASSLPPPRYWDQHHLASDLSISATVLR